MNSRNQIKLKLTFPGAHFLSCRKESLVSKSCRSLSSWLSDHDIVHLKTLFIGLFLALLIDSHAKIRRMVRSVVARRKIRQLARQYESVDNDTTTRTVAGLYIYPCKSMRATLLSECKIDARGLVGDRRFMVVCENPPSVHGLAAGCHSSLCHSTTVSRSGDHQCNT